MHYVRRSEGRPLRADSRAHVSKRARLAIVLGCVAALCNLHIAAHAGQSAGAAGVEHGYRVVNVFPHDPRSFTQGLVYDRGGLLESSGGRGTSTLRRVDLRTGKVERMVRLPRRFFAEGIAVAGERILQLTWQAGKGFIYDLETFSPRGEFHYRTEGWGLAHDGERLIMSDGTSTLRFVDPVGLRVAARLAVRDAGRPVEYLNELEFVRGRIYANVWRTDRIAVIDPESGHVEAWIDLGGLLTPQEAKHADVLNGIAYDAAKDRLFVTGKLWPKLFEIEIVPRL